MSFRFFSRTLISHFNLIISVFFQASSSFFTRASADFRSIVRTSILCTFSVFALSSRRQASLPALTFSTSLCNSSICASISFSTYFASALAEVRFGLAFLVAPYFSAGRKYFYTSLDCPGRSAFFRGLVSSTLADSKKTSSL
jgi:hypothetical protein